MTSTNSHLQQALQLLIRKYIKMHQDTHGHLPTVISDDDWLSPCEAGNSTQGLSYWQPVLTSDLVQASDLENTDISVSAEILNFANIESALGLTLHQDIKAYFTYVFSAELEAECDEGALSLLFAWNGEDFQRLQENLIGHILMKQRLKQPLTLFFAVTDEEDMIISLDNTTGEIWVEQVGCKPHKKLSHSLTEFINGLTPLVKKKVDNA